MEKAERKAKKVDKEKVVKKVDKKQTSKEEEALELSEFRSPRKEVHETAATTDNPMSDSHRGTAIKSSHHVNNLIMLITLRHIF